MGIDAMRTNADLTVYNRYTAAGAEAYQRTQIEAVAWEHRKARNSLASGGNINADSSTVYIPMARGANYLQPKEWQALVSKTGKWTLQPGDYIVKGLVTDEITTGFSVTSLKAKYNDVLMVSSVDTMDGGSANLHHWQLGAK
jgi:hypothetical protein